MSLDEHERRLVWTSEGALAHYNASVQVFPTATGSRVTWQVDFLPDEAAPRIMGMVKQGMAAMQAELGP